MTIVECKVTKFIDVAPTILPYIVPEDISEEELYWILKELLYDDFNIKYVEIVSINRNVTEDEYFYQYGGSISLVNTINKYYQNPNIPEHKTRDKDKLECYHF